MAKAIKTLAIVSVFALVISSFTACSLSHSNEPTTTEPTTTETTTEPTTDEPTTTEPEKTAAPTEPQSKRDSIENIFDDIKNLPIGTAGSSAKAANLALRLIAFSNSDLAESDTLEDDVRELVDTVDDEDTYGEALYQVNSYAKKFFKGKQADVAEIAGESDFPLNKEYSQEKYQKVYELLKQN